MKVVITVDVPASAPRFLSHPNLMALVAAMHAGALLPLSPLVVTSSLEIHDLETSLGQATKESKEDLGKRFETAMQDIKLRQAVSSVDKFCGSMIDTGKLEPEVAATLKQIRKILSGGTA
jgi:hypothetical protein